MRRVSLVFSSKSLSIERTALGDLLRRRWLIATLRRKNFPVPVILTRFAMALCVFSFCFMFLLSMFFGRRGLGNRFFESSAARLSAWAHDKEVEAQEERGSVGSDSCPTNSILFPQILHRRRREAYVRSTSRCATIIA